MPTTVTKVLGTGGDYTTLQAWEDACPADLTVVDQIWEGQCKNELFTQAHNAGSLLTVGGTTCDATRFLHLTTQAGASFVDDAGAATNPLKYDSSKGASIDPNSSYSSAIVVSGAGYNVKISKLQITNTETGTSSNGIAFQGDYLTLSQVIHEINCASSFAHLHAEAFQTAIFKNCLIVNRASSAPRLVEVYRGSEFYNCTIAVPSDKTAATLGISYSYSTTSTVQNTAVFGAAAVHGTHGGSLPSITATTNKTDMASPPSGWTTVAYDTTTGSGFEGTTDAARDFRIKAASALKDAGTTDATNAPFDIIGYARALWDIGAWEAESGSVTRSPGAGAAAFTGLAPVAQIDVPVYGSLGQFDPQLSVTAWF